MADLGDIRTRLAAIREGLEAIVLKTLALEDALEKNILPNPEKHSVYYTRLEFPEE